MTVIECFECDVRLASVEELQTHLWTTHLPATSRDGEETRCPSCTLPLRESTLRYHYPCLYDVDEIGFFVEEGVYLCPICGGDHPTKHALDNHLKSHLPLARIEYLGDSHTCTACGESLSPDLIGTHLGCLLEVTEATRSEDDQGRYRCPASSCTAAFTRKGNALGHLWYAHFEEQTLSGSCPGCTADVDFGAVQSHLACLEGCVPAETTKLLPARQRTCILCGYKAFNPDALHRHYGEEHLSTSAKCPECADPVRDREGADALDHIVCLARHENKIPLAGIDEQWYCPICATTISSRDALKSHLTDEHLSLLVEYAECHRCERPIQRVEDHHKCLIRIGDFSTLGQSDNSEHVTHSAVASRSPETYFDNLEEFVDLEIQAARDEAWERYQTQSLSRLVREKIAIPELVPIGPQYHPRYDQQLVYQHATDGDESADEIDLFDEFEIYPGTEVAIGSDTERSTLPQTAVVTFVDGPTIGIALLSKHGAVDEALLRQLTSDADVYHLVELINPKPFERERKAISQVKADDRLRNLVLGDAPVSERPVRIPREAVGELNQYQQETVERALGIDDVLCIHGPPGTGKTRTLTRLIRLAVARGDRVLATSHSNQAIDNLLVGSSTSTTTDDSALHHVASPAGRERTLPPNVEVRLAENPDDEELQETAARLLERPDELTIARVGENTTSSVVRREYVGAAVGEADLVAGTMNSLAELKRDDQFDLVVIDEAGQAAQPASFIPLLRGRKVVLAGDHLQLPPYVADETAKEEEMHISLFEHLMETYGSEISVMLRRQYRMNEAIAAFPSKHIYDDRLETGEPNRTWTIDDLQPIMAVDIDGEERTDETTHSKSNPSEAEIVANHVKLLHLSDVELKDIGVITPYGAQIGAIRRAVTETIGHCGDLKIDTIDSFQGSEREAIIVSFVRSNPGNHTGFLALPEEGRRRLNVALTRAKKRLVLIGDWNTLGSFAHYEDPDTSCSQLYATLYSHLNARSLVKEISPRQASR